MIQESDAIHAKILKKNEIRRNKSDCLDHMTSGHSVGLRPQEIGSHESHLERKRCTFTLVSHTAQMKSNCLYYGDKKKKTPKDVKQPNQVSYMFNLASFYSYNEINTICSDFPHISRATLFDLVFIISHHFLLAPHFCSSTLGPRITYVKHLIKRNDRLLKKRYNGLSL